MTVANEVTKIQKLLVRAFRHTDTNSKFTFVRRSTLVNENVTRSFTVFD